MTYRIRRSKQSDLNSILELSDEFLKYTVEHGFDPDIENNTELIEKTKLELTECVLHPKRREYRPIYVFDLDNKIIGYTVGMCVPRMPEATLENIFISKEFRYGGRFYKQGRGVKLASKFLIHCKRAGVPKVFVEPYVLDHDAETFYLSSSMQFTESRNPSSNPLKKRLEKIL